MRGELPSFLPSAAHVCPLFPRCWRFHSTMSAWVIFMSCFFSFSQQCVRHILILKRDGYKMKQEGKNNGGKVIWREIVFPALYDCRIILSLDVPRCYKAASKHLSHIGEWRSASQCFTLHHSCGKQSAGRDFYGYLFHLLSWHSS